MQQKLLLDLKPQLIIMSHSCKATLA